MWVGVGDDRDALPAELGEVAVGRPDWGSSPILSPPTFGIRVHARPDEGEVHLQRHLAGFVGVDVLGHVPVRRARRRAALVEVLVELQPLDRLRRVDEALHVIGLVRVLVLEALVVEDVGHAHGDALRAALGVDRRAVDLLAVDLAALEELGDVLQLV